jgi:quaternary ammonium compound-resistance protein SugE
MAWIYLLLAGLFEIGFTSAMRYIDGWRPWPLLAFLLFATLSFSCLTEAIKTIPLGTAYAVWTGIGAAGTALVGIFIFGEAATALRIFFICTLIGSIIGLKMFAG